MIDPARWGEGQWVFMSVLKVLLSVCVGLLEPWCFVSPAFPQSITNGLRSICGYCTNSCECLHVVIHHNKIFRLCLCKRWICLVICFTFCRQWNQERGITMLIHLPTENPNMSIYWIKTVPLYAIACKSNECGNCFMCTSVTVVKAVSSFQQWYWVAPNPWYLVCFTTQTYQRVCPIGRQNYHFVCLIPGGHQLPQ